MSEHSDRRKAALSVDVLTVGAGSAGTAAAIAAAETGARTLVVERSGHVGGTLAWQLLEHSAGFHSAMGSQVVAGVAQRLVSAAVRRSASPGHIRDDVGYTASRTPIDHAAFAMIEATVLDDSGAQLWLDSMPLSTYVEDGCISTVEVASPAGPISIHAGVVIDATGDAAVAEMAGAEMLTDHESDVQPLSLLFKLGNVDVGKVLAWAAANPSEMRPGSVVADSSAEYANFWGFRSILQSGWAEGALSFERQEMHVAAMPRRGELILNVTRLRETGGDVAYHGKAYAVLARQVLEVTEWCRKKLPGCERAYISAVGDRVGVRESRRVKGKYVLTANDVRSGAVFSDTVACGAFPLDVHSNNTATMASTSGSNVYQIPMRALVSSNIRNLLMAGRCISSTHLANGSVRISATCFATGEAAGVAAAILSKTGGNGDLDVGQVQSILTSREAILHIGA